VAEAPLRSGKSFRILSFLLLLLLAWLLGQEGVPVEDGPELLTVARLGGTNHPPGMPLLSLLCRASWVLLGQGGLRVLFALMAAASLWLLSDGRGLPGLILAAGVLLLPEARERLLQWDAYGPLFLLFAAGYRFRRADALLAGLLTGLAMAVHPMGILLALLWVSRRTPPLKALCGILLGLSIYLALPLYSAAGAVVDWGSPSRLGSFFRQVSAGGYREVYGPQMGGQALRPLAKHAIVLGKMLWPVLGAMTAIGLVAFIRRHWGIAARLGALLVAEGLFVWLVNPMAAGTSQTGVLALAARPVVDETALAARPNRPVVVLDAPRHLGNVGAAVRVAAAADAAGVVVVGEVDPWQPAAVRGAAGLQFALPCLRVDAATCFDRPLVGFDAGGAPLAARAVAPASALVFGSERHGLTPATRRAVDRLVALPMRRGVSSLNLATAVAAALYTVAPPATPPDAA